ncbi:MAG: 2-C-methyl-D-erythritol 2,4-cyclodiphosphate synthase [Candidatus Aminicenantales bacterium]
MKIKPGIGYDIHKLVRGRKLFLGGLEIPFSLGLAGHSDGDVVIHALIDALLGAMGEGDIGQLFPDTKAEYKNIRSTELLKDIMGRLKKKNYKIVHIDTILIVERPKLAPYLSEMKKMLCPILHIREESLGIKAKTNEGLGAIGRGKAIACWALALLTGRPSD